MLSCPSEFEMRAHYIRNTILGLLTLFLFSCGAKKAAETLTVIAPENFSGRIRITTCHLGAASDNIVIDSAGAGITSVCSVSPDLTLQIVRGNQRDVVGAELVKTGDGFVIGITSRVAPKASSRLSRAIGFSIQIIERAPAQVPRIARKTSSMLR